MRGLETFRHRKPPKEKFLQRLPKVATNRKNVNDDIEAIPYKNNSQRSFPAIQREHLR